MTDLTAPAGPPPGGGGHPALVRSGADLVELVERLYLGLFRVALGLTGGAAVLGIVYAAIEPRDWHGGLTAALAAASAAAALLTYRLPGTYRWLRGRWWGPGLPAVLGGLMLVVDGPGGPLWFAALAGIGVTSVLARPHHTAVLALAVGGCYLLGTVLAGASLAARHDPGRLAAAGGLVLDGLVCAAVVEWLARFVLQLHRHELEATGWVQAPVRVGTVAGPDGARPPRRPSSPRLPRGASRLTARQLEVVVLLRDGLRQSEIAACLSISPRQVERLVKEARERSGAATTTALVALLVNGGLTPPPATVESLDSSLSPVT